MNKALLKFRDYLSHCDVQCQSEFKKEYFKLNNNLEPHFNKSNKRLDDLEEKHNILESFLEILDENKFNKINELFKDYWDLSYLLESSPLNLKEKSSVIFEVIQNNLNKKLLEKEAMVIDTSRLSNHTFKTMNSKEAKLLIYQIGVCHIDEREDLTELEKARIAEIYRYVEKNAINISEFIENHHQIKIHYLDKLTSYTKEDIEVVKIALKKLDVTPKMIQNIEVFLNKEMERRLDVKQDVVLNWGQPNYQRQQLLKDKEYKKIRKELSSYYNQYENQLLKDLSFEDSIYCVSLMIELGYTEKDINTFLLRVETTKPIETNSITEFVSNYKKYIFYQDDYQIKEKMDTILEYLSVIFMNVEEKEYKDFKHEIREELIKLKYLIPDNYQYEKSLAKKLIKQKKEPTNHS